MLHRRKREQAGGVDEFKAGDWTAKQYPSGKLTVACTAAIVRGPGLRPLPPSPYIHAAPFGCCPDALPFNCADLNAVPPELVHGLAERNPDFMELLRWASWA
jgi:hypothetical protein